ncbi:MAG: hypothetical protein ABSG22_10225 [Sedimentisphaerales bacterium]|jgi:transcription initiation factor TFIIIB Brf1 subunit/transcription initiation factor TFIIB
MSQDRKSRINYRCPNCFAKEVDVDLLYDKKKDEYYCIKCCFVGTEADILRSYEQNKAKYKVYKKMLNLLNPVTLTPLVLIQETRNEKKNKKSSLVSDVSVKWDRG